MRVSLREEGEETKSLFKHEEEKKERMVCPPVRVRVRVRPPDS